MLTFTPRARHYLLKAVRIVVAVLAVIVLVVAAAHLPIVRRALLRQATAQLQSRLDIVLRADGLTYNLALRRARLTGVTVAAAHDPQMPFLTMASVDVAVPWRVLFGSLAFDAIRLDDANLSIVQRRDGTTNLPRSKGGGTADPGAIAIGRLTVPRLGVHVSSEPDDLSIEIPALRIDLGPGSGTIEMDGPAEIRRGDVSETLIAAGGGAAFDGRSLRLTRFRLETAAASVTIDGTLTLLAAAPGVDARAAGSGDVRSLARWATSAPPFDGRATFEGTVNGPFSALSVRGRARSESLSRPGLTLSAVDATFSLDRNGIAARIDAGLAAGRTRLTAAQPAGGETEVTLSWSDLDAATLVRALAAGVTPRPAARTSGSARARGTGASLAGWAIDASATVRAVPASAGQVEISGAPRLRASAGQWRLDGEVGIGGVPLQVDVGGRLNAGSVGSSTLRGTVAASGASIDTLVAAMHTAGILADQPAAPVGGSLDLTATLAGTLSQPGLQLDGQARGLAVGGIAGVDADLTAEGTMARATAEARIRRDDNEVTALATVRPQARRVEFQLTGRLPDPAALMSGVPVGGVVVLRFDGGGPWSSIEGRGSLDVTGARYGGVDLGDLTAGVVLDSRDASVDLIASAIGVTAQARMGRDDRRAVVDLQAADVELDRVLPDGALPAGLTGRVSLTAHGEGLPGDWRRGAANVVMSSLAARFGELPIDLTAPARLAFADGIVDVRALEATIGGLRLAASGRLPAFGPAPAAASADSVQAVIVGDVAQALEAARVAGPAAAGAELSRLAGAGPLALIARITGIVEQPEVSADLELGPARVTFDELPAATGLVLRARLSGDRLDILSGAAEWQQSRVTIAGGAPLRLFEGFLPAALLGRTPAAGPAVLRVTASSITPEVLAPFVDAESLAQIEGTVDATAQLEASALSWERVQGEVRLDRFEARVAALPIAQRLPTRVVIANGVARVAEWDWSGQGAAVTVGGQIGLADGQADLRADARLDLRMLTPFVREAGLVTAGTVTTGITASGPVADLRIGGEMTLAAGEVRLERPRILVTELTSQGVLDGRRVQFRDLSGSINGGRLSGSVEIVYPSGEPASMRAVAGAAGMALEFPDGLRSELDADLTVTLTGAPDGTTGRVSGLVTMTRSAYREPLSVVNTLLAAARARRLAPPAPEPSLLDRLALDVRVVTDSDVTVENNLVRLELGGDLRLIGTAAAPGMSGRAEVREGGELFLGRNRYAIDAGTISFDNPATIAPDLDIQARTRAGGEDIELTLTGTPDALDVELRSPSQPGMGQADLASLLMTGRPLAQVPGAEGQIIAEQAIGFLSGDILGAVSRVVGVDTIRLGGAEASTLRDDPATIAAQADPTSRLTFGKRIGNLFEVTLSQSLREGDAQTWILDYQPFRRVNLRFVSNDETLRSYEFRHDVSFGDALAARPQPAARPSGDARVTAVAFTGFLPVPESRLRAALDLEPGDRFQAADWQRDRDRVGQVLHEAGYFEARVTADRAEDATGIALTYAVAAGPRTVVDVTGFTLPREAVAAIERAWSQFVVDDFLEDEASGIVRQALTAEGYLQPRVAVDLVSGSGGTAGAQVRTLAIAIEAGDRTLGRQLEIESGDAALDEVIFDWVRAQGLEDAGWRDPAGLQRALEAYLRAGGRLRARVAVAAPRVDGTRAVVVAAVDAGPVVTIRDLEFRGAGSLSREALAAAAGLAAGEPYDLQQVESARQRVESAYRGAGFSRAQVALQPAPAGDAAALDVVFVINAGPQQVLREIVVLGNDVIDTDVVTRALRLEVGQVIGTSAWLEARARLFDTALFRRVDVAIEPIADLQTGPEQGRAGPADPPGQQPVRVRVIVEEWPALRLRYGFQLAEHRPEGEVSGRDLSPGLSADLTRRTVFGRAVTLGGAVEYQRRERMARVFLNAPTMFGWPLESLLTAAQSREAVSAAFVSDLRSVAWEQRASVASRLRLSYSYSFERDHTFNPDAPADDPLAFDITVNIARLTGAAVYDTRDDAIDTSRGTLLSSSLEYAPESLGSELQFVRHLAQAYHFRPWRGIVLASAARLGTVTPLGGQLLLSSERFFAGGSRTVRGVAEDDLGPRDVFGDAAGGGGLLVLNQEVRFPLYRWLRGVAFADAGNIFATPSEIRPGDLVGSFGAGLRISTPVVLLRIDYARLWSPSPSDSAGRWAIGIGHTF